ncbi:hypothetical protein VP01_4457g1, partial [Puccinia sorghi]
GLPPTMKQSNCSSLLPETPERFRKRAVKACTPHHFLDSKNVSRYNLRLRKPAAIVPSPPTPNPRKDLPLPKAASETTSRSYPCPNRKILLETTTELVAITNILTSRSISSHQVDLLSNSLINYRRLLIEGPLHITICERWKMEAQLISLVKCAARIKKIPEAVANFLGCMPGSPSG